MNLYHLKCFVDAARQRSMTKAAELNFLSRPAISHAIKSLEIELGDNLVVHKRRAFELTSTGHLLLSKADDLLGQIDELKASVKNHEGKAFGCFRIGSARTLATFSLAPVINHLKQSFPNLSPKLVIANSETLIEKLANREIDMALILGDDTLHGCKEVVVGKGSFLLIKPKNGNPLDYSYALTDRRPETERARTIFKREFGTEIPVFSEIPSWDAIWHWVNSGLCGGLVPKFLLDHAPTREQIEVVFPKVFPYEIKAVFSKQREQDPVVQIVLRALCSER